MINVGEKLPKSSSRITFSWLNAWPARHESSNATTMHGIFPRDLIDSPSTGS